MPRRRSTVAVAVLLVTTMAGADRLPDALAHELIGCWTIDGGHRLVFSGASGAMRVRMEGFAPAGAAYDSDVDYDRTSRVARFRASLAMVPRAVWFSIRSTRRGLVLERWDWDHSRLMRGGSARHPLRVDAAWTLSRCER